MKPEGGRPGRLPAKCANVGSASILQTKPRTRRLPLDGCVAALIQPVFGSQAEPHHPLRYGEDPHDLLR
jgi:hypothetical protein